MENKIHKTSLSPLKYDIYDNKHRRLSCLTNLREKKINNIDENTVYTIYSMNASNSYSFKG